LLPRNFKLTIEYDGTDYSGWQIQKNNMTVQGEIEYALQKIFQQNKIKLTGAGRTDAGVHAKEQGAHVFLESIHTPEKIKNALNGNIRKDIWIKTCEEIDPDFHARYSAKVREYRYFISTEYSPLNKNREWYLPRELDLELLEKCAKLIIGKHDFTSFCKANSDVKNKICNVFTCNWTLDKNNLIFTIRANRYLQHMVRYLVGTMTEVARGRYIIDQFKNLLNMHEKNIQVFRAPAHGLYLWRIEYE
tara:strand:- start:395 stop:1135 length:741 start_codon:yes stop_codon:yes gene_type:complete